MKRSLMLLLEQPNSAVSIRAACLGACPRISLISSLHRSLAYQLYAGGDATLVASPWLCNAIAAPEGRARRRGMPSEGAHTAKSARSTSP